jgi:hypothetical protein|tara:strand:+ start:231 stop:620 length:390 start_codon:yes stop_codon:yes gene_type:complete
MSTILVNTLTGTSTAGSIAVTGEGNSTTTNLQQGLAKAWSFTAADGASISDSFNISSLGDTAAGQQTLNFNNDFGSANHSVVASQGTGNQHDVVMSTKAAGTQLIKIYDPDAGAFQDSLINAVAHGDLA